MILDQDAGVRAAGYQKAPVRLADARDAFAVALEDDGAVADDALGFLEDHADPVAREILVEAMLAREATYAQYKARIAVATINARRHHADPAADVPPFEPWPDGPAPPGWAETAYGAIDHVISGMRRSITVSRSLADERGEVFDQSPESWYAHAQRTIGTLSQVTLQDCDETARAISGHGRVHPAVKSLPYQEALLVSAGLSPMQHLRLFADPELDRAYVRGIDYAGLDLRLLVDAYGRIGVRRPLTVVARAYFSSDGSYVDRALAWPLLLEQPGALDDALGLAVPEMPVEEPQLVRALGVLREMPALPRRYLPRVVQVAIEGKARSRKAAREVLAVHVDPRPVALQGLTHGRAPVRASSATWLAELGGVEALAALEAALETEGSPATRTALADATAKLRSRNGRSG